MEEAGAPELRFDVEDEGCVDLTPRAGGNSTR
jgi:hypothetical protein